MNWQGHVPKCYNVLCTRWLYREIVTSYHNKTVVFKHETTFEEGVRKIVRVGSINSTICMKSGKALTSCNSCFPIPPAICR